MPRVTCLGLPIPAKRYRLDTKKTATKHMHGFEKLRSAMDEDQLRARKLLRAGSLLSPYKAKRAKKLAKRLANHKQPTSSLSSSVYMRDWRVRICGNLWRMMRKNRDLELSFFTIIPADWAVPEGKLDEFVPDVMFGRLRTALYRRGAGQSPGFMFAALHGEHQPELGVYQLHIHGVAGGKMTDVIDRLRTSSNYRSVRTGGTKDGVWQRVQIDREPFKNLPKVATYVLKAYWPRQSRCVRDDGSSVAIGEKARISEPYHSEVLLWLDGLELPDILFSIGVSCSSKGLKITHRGVK